MRGSLANRTHLPGGCGIPAPHPALRGHLLPMGEGKKNKRPLAAYTATGGIFMPQILPVLLGGDANVYGMARSFYECYGVRSLAVCRRALPALRYVFR